MAKKIVYVTDRSVKPGDVVATKPVFGDQSTAVVAVITGAVQKTEVSVTKTSGDQSHTEMRNVSEGRYNAKIPFSKAELAALIKQYTGQ